MRPRKKNNHDFIRLDITVAITRILKDENIENRLQLLTIGVVKKPHEGGNK
jgi:hypothetical protein